MTGIANLEIECAGLNPEFETKSASGCLAAFWISITGIICVVKGLIFDTRI